MLCQELSAPRNPIELPAPVRFRVAEDCVPQATAVLDGVRRLVVLTLHGDHDVGIRPIGKDVKVANIVKAFPWKALKEVNAPSNVLRVPTKYLLGAQFQTLLDAFFDLSNDRDR